MKVILLLILGFCIAPNIMAASFDHKIWDELLKRNVVDLKTGISTSVDYAAMMRSRASLKRYLNELSSVNKNKFNAWSHSDQLAFLINAYNAWTIDLVLTRYPKLTSIKDLGGFFSSPWRKKFIPLFGNEISLDDLEHDFIFAENIYHKPRVHFALNCASKGCPTLRAEAYIGEKLELQLEDQTQLFLSDFSRNRFNGRDLQVSLIFKWYKKDFENEFNSVNDFLSLYAFNLSLSEENIIDLKAGKIKIKFLEYDWRLNDK